MPFNPPVKGAAFEFSVALEGCADANRFKVNPTLAAGDVKISKDGGALANLATLPSVEPASSTLVSVELSATEMNADKIVIVFSDQTDPPEWADFVYTIVPTEPLIPPEEIGGNLISPQGFIGTWEAGGWGTAEGLSAWNHGQADPLGGTEATLVVESTSSGAHQNWIFLTRGETPSVTGTFRCYIKRHSSGTPRDAALVLKSPAAGLNYAECLIDLSDGTIIHQADSGDVTLDAVEAVDVGGGWWRCKITATFATTTTEWLAQIFLAEIGPETVDEAVNYEGDNTGAIVVWRDYACIGTLDE